MIHPETGTTYVDNTTLRAVAECSTRTALRHSLGMSVMEEKVQLEAGIAFHEVMADFMQGKPAAYCLQKFEILYRGYSEELSLHAGGPLQRLSWENLDAVLRELFERRPLAAYPFKVNPKLVEVGIQVPLSDECVCGMVETAHLPGNIPCNSFRPAFVMWGRLDAIVQANHDGALYVLDHKSTGRLSPYMTEKFRNDSQMTGYVWAAQATLGQRVAGVFINAVEFSKLPGDPVRKCREHGTTYSECGPLHMKTELLIYTRSPTQLEQWRRDAVTLARKYREIVRSTPDISSLTELPMEGTFSGACGFCEFAKFCQAEREPGLVQSMMVHNPWRPFEHGTN